jgi:rare lipoprotein A (peptidoglycan hydrolase)
VKTARFSIALLAALGVASLFGITAASAHTTRAVYHHGCSRPYVDCSAGGHMLRYRGHGPEWWARRWHTAHRRLMQMHHRRRAASQASTTTSGWHSAVASYYGTDGISGGCGMANGPFTFASLIVPCGAQVQFCRGGACVTGTRTDSGPYIAGRSFDLSTEMASTLGFTSAGVASVSWRLVH